jgi:hypothetical protein
MIGSYFPPEEMRRRSTRLVSPRVEALMQVDGWSPDNVAVGVVDPEGVRDWHGDEAREFRWASITKPWSRLRPSSPPRKGVVDLDEEAGPPGSTVRHLLSARLGLPFDGTVQSRAGASAHLLERRLRGARPARRAPREMPFVEYLTRRCSSRSSSRASCAGRPRRASTERCSTCSSSARSSSVRRSSRRRRSRRRRPSRSPGSSACCPTSAGWTRTTGGLGVEVRGSKSPHWTGTRNSPRTFGHFGGSGTFLWIDPDAKLALGLLTDRDFDDWSDEAKRVWPELSDAVLAEASG